MRRAIGWAILICLPIPSVLVLLWASFIWKPMIEVYPSSQDEYGIELLEHPSGVYDQFQIQLGCLMIFVFICLISYWVWKLMIDRPKWS